LRVASLDLDLLDLGRGYGGGESTQRRTSMLLVTCDGACEPKNPGGTATWGYVIFQDGQVLTQELGVVGKGKGMTNNVAEYAAVVQALYRVPDYKGQGPIKLCGDSKLWVEQLNGRWQANPDAPYYPYYVRAKRELERVRKDFAVTVEWIPREQNEAADALTREALEREGVTPRIHPR
jgi:ribonuclease HI